MVAERALIRIDDVLYPLRELSARREFLALILILAETMIVYLIAGTLLATLAAPYVPLSVIIVFFVLFLSRLVPHLLSTLRIMTPHYEVTLIVSIITMMLIVIKLAAFPEAPLLSFSWLEGTVDALILRESEAIRSVWLLVLFVAIAWWRGKTRAEPNLETGYTMLRLGVIWLGGGLLFTVLANPENAQILEQVHAILAGFVVFSLLAIAVARQPEGEQAAAWNMSLMWVFILTLPILLVAVTSLTMVGILTRNTLELLFAVLLPVLWLFQFLVQALVLTIAIIAFILISPLIWLLERQGFGPIEGFPSFDLSPTTGVDGNGAGNTLLQVEDPARYLIVGAILISVMWLLVRFSFKRRRNWEEEPRQQHESLIEWDPSPTVMLRAFKGWLLRNVRPAHAALGPLGDEWAATRRIRLAYRQFLRTNSSSDLRRGTGETPVAYGNRLEQIYQARAHDIRLITSRYNQARYSGKPALERDADDTEHALDSFQQSEH